MLAVLGDYLKNLDSEIESYEQLIAQKREEVQKLTQLQGQVVEALGLLNSLVDELRIVDPAAIATIQAAALQIFNNGSESQSSLSPLNNGLSNSNVQILALDANNPLEVATIADKNGIKSPELNANLTAAPPPEEETTDIRLSANVIYEPDNSIVYAGINAYNRTKVWGEWLCLTHTVGDRFEILSKSRSESYNYDLVVFGIEPEDAQRLADADLTKQPHAPENNPWQPQKRHPQTDQPQQPICKPGDLAKGDIAQTMDGQEHRVIGVSNDGSVVKVISEDNREMAYSIGVLSLIKKAEPQPDDNSAIVQDAFSNGKSSPLGWEIGNQVLIHSSRYQGKYDGKIGAIATEPSNLGLKVDMGSETPVFFLKDEVALLN